MKKGKGQSGLKGYAELLIRAALAEDIGSGDITTNAIVKKNEAGDAEFIAREEMAVAGLFIPEMVFGLLDKKAVFKARVKEGGRAKKGQVIATVHGSLAALLIGERVALNFLQRLSGIATITNEFAGRIKNTKVKLLDTRKTTPCMRALEKYAVMAGGGTNHRFGLFDLVLIKDNHIMAAGSVTAAIEAVKRKYRDAVPIEVEVTDLNELKEALASGADIIMLDNMGIPMIRQAVKLIAGNAFIEVSGNINIGNIGKVAKEGIDFISVGALTHSARAVDISMEVVSLCGTKKQKSR